MASPGRAVWLLVQMVPKRVQADSYVQAKEWFLQDKKKIVFFFDLTIFPAIWCFTWVFRSNVTSDSGRT